MRYEVTIRPEFAFGFGYPSFEEIRAPLEIVSAGRTFVWHPSRPAPDGHDRCGPVVSVVQSDEDQDAAALATNRLLAAVSYALDMPIGIGWSMVTGFKQHLDPPTACELALTSRMFISPVTEVQVAIDERLYHVLGLYREGVSAESPYHHFLSLHNALVTTFDGNEDDAENYATEHESRAPDVPSGVDALGSYFRDVMRNAIAHTVRPPGRPVLDPNGPGDRAKAAAATRPLRHIVRQRVEERWPGGVRALRAGR